MKNINLIRKIAHGFNKAYCVPFDELFSEACLAYLEAELSYNLAKETAFTTYATVCIKNRLRNFCKAEKEFKHISTDILEISEFLTEKLKTEPVEFEPTTFAQDIKEVIAVILQSPIDFASLSPRIARGKLRKQLCEKGWKQKQISETFKKTSKCINELKYSSILIPL